MKNLIYQLRKNFIILFSVLLFILAGSYKAQAQKINKNQLSQLKFRFIGPVGNRTISVAGIPGDPMIYYVGAASGGIWKTEDGGIKIPKFN